MTSKQEHFIQDLVQFYRNRGIASASPAQFVARLNGKNVDLCELYSCVLEFGGSYKVNQANNWDEIYFRLFKTNYIGANFAVALRQIYNRYLLQYEKSCNGNFSSEQWNEDDDDENAIFSHANSTSSSVQYSHAINHHARDNLNNVIDSNGQMHNDSKLYCSLLSGLPNELNFAFNVATILSNCQRFDWTNDYKFINVLLESMNSYCCVCDHFDEARDFGRDTFTEEDEILKFEKVIKSSFCKNNINDNENFDITKRKPNGTIQSTSQTSKFGLPTKKIDFIEQKCNCFIQFWYQVCSDKELLDLVFIDSYESIDFDSPFLFKDFPQELFNKIEKRITLVADIIRNISFSYNPNNANHVLMTPLVKFLTLLLRSDNVRYVNISLEILSNIASALSNSFSKPYENEYFYLLHFLFKYIVDLALNSNNIHDTTKSYEIMARYISNNHEANLLLETHFPNNKIYERITQLLTCHYDIHLVLALLEFGLALSECRPHVLVNNDNKTFLKILVNLLNCQVTQHFTTGALEKIKIIDTRPQEETRTSDSTSTKTATISQMQCQPNLPPVLNNHQQVMDVQKSTPVLSNQVPVINLNALDNESFAIHWLKTTYDIGPASCWLKINDIYAEYVKYCCRNSRRNVIAAQSFNFLLKRCFPDCKINQTLVEGLILKGQQLIVEDQMIKKPAPNTSSQMSPILKAHLSTPPKIQLNPNESAVQNAATPTTTNTSTLIKSLLANKLRNNQQQVVNPSSSTQHQVNLQTTQVVLPNNEVTKTVADVNAGQKVIIANQPATSFAITPTIFSNNIIVPSSIQSQVPNQLQGSQIFLVRTIITAPGQQNAGSPVRLLVPASMITQPRLATPALNGINTPTSIATNVQTVSNNPTTAPAIIQTQQQVTNTTQPNVNPNSVPVIVQTPQQPAIQSSAPIKNSSIANSSPLLNVLLDKGKLPDFPQQNSSQPITQQQNIVANNSVTNSVIQQPKMIFLAQNQTTKPNNVVVNNIASNDVAATPKLSNTTKANVTLSIPTTNPVVNGDMKVSNIKINNSVKNLNDNSSLPELNKRLKTGIETESMKPLENNGEEVKNGNNGQNKNPNSNVVSASIVNSTVHATNVEQNKSQPPTTETINNQVKINVPAPTADYECQWNNCQKKFARPTDVFYHVHSQHIMTVSCPSLMNCLWGGPEGRGPGCLAKRPKLSLLTHLQDFHCNPQILKQESLRSKQLAMMGTSNIILPQPPAHPGYAQNAAMLAIRRYTNKIIESSESITPLSPLTVSIRLTSALILRNLAKRSHVIKKSLLSFESQLCEISAAEGRDESRTIAQCLALLNENK